MHDTSKSLVFFKFHGIAIPDGFSKSFTKSQFSVIGDTLVTTAGQSFRFYKNRAFPVDAIEYVRIKSVDHVATVLFACQLTSQELHRTSTGSVGLWFNIKPFITFSNGQQLYAPRFIERNANSLRKLHDRMQNCTSPKTAKRRAQQRTHLSRYAKSKLEDWHYKTAHRICRRFSDIYVPVALPASRFAADYDFAGFVRKLRTVSEKYDVNVNNVPLFVLVCPHCGTEHTAKIRPQDRSLLCVHCGTCYSRDLARARQVENFY